jgi:hypothetical protein
VGLFAALGLVAVGVGAASAAHQGTAPHAAAVAEDCHTFDGSALDVSPGGAHQDPNAVSAAEADRIEREAEVLRMLQPRSALAAAPAGVDVDVYVHVFYDRDTDRGNISADSIWDQMTRFNRTFSGYFGGSGTRFDFVLKSYERVPLDSVVVVPHSDKADRLARENHTGGKRTLNIWVADLDGAAGYATFPWDVDDHPNIDGVWADFSTFPGTAAGDSGRSGDTVPHEAGHWLGLWHTHQNGCSDPGDSVDDTPYSQLDAFFDCTPGETTRDSCPNRAGNDPVRNIMSYAHDDCRDRFTSDQATRMSNRWDLHRAS